MKQLVPKSVLPEDEEPSVWWFEPFGIEHDLLNKIVIGCLPKAIPVSGVALVKRNVPLPPESGDSEGRLMCWPSTGNGIAMAIRKVDEITEVVGVWPDFARGVEHEVVMDRLWVTKDGLQAIVEGTIGDGFPICWFDPHYLADRGFHTAGYIHSVLLLGIAHRFAVSEPEVFWISLGDTAYKVMSEMQPSCVGADGRIEVSTKGMASFLPISDQARNVYHVGGTVTQVSEFPGGVMGHAVWLVRVVVARTGTEDDPQAIDILLTDHTLAGRFLPNVGEDINASIVLNGSIWMPNVRAVD